jgi:glycyl-tRNA synthetase beta chain
MKKLTHKNALLEIGTEELPARFVTPALTQLKELAENLLSAEGLEFHSIQTWGTPRRLVIFIHGLSEKAKDMENIVVGPPPNVAQNDKGEWTPVAVGFAKAQNIPVKQLEFRETPKGKRLVAVHQRKGQPADLLLKNVFPSIIQKLYFPKTMVWEPTRFRFARPMRWLLALYGSKVVRFRLAGVTSDRNSFGLLALGGKKIIISNADKYKNTLQGRCILVDPDDRRTNILKMIDAQSKKLKATPLTDETLLDEVIHLTEYPTAIVGQFQESYLVLPKEVLISVLKKHQKFFPIESSKGKLINSFIGIRNGLSDQQDTVRDGYERVLSARLADAHFFFEHDLKTRLDQLAPKLSGIGFHEKLGSLLDKTARVDALIDKLQRWLALPDDTLENAKRAAHLAKADLLTQMVGEFPELQGVAGRFYAERQEKKEVATAIEEHLWPLSADGKLPTSVEGAVVSLADKLDTLAADFSVGLIPTGSNDPYALRRAAIGVIRILIEWKWDVSLQDLVNLAYEGLKDKTGQKELIAFFEQRLSAWFENQGFRPDEVEAVLANRDQSLITLREKLKELKVVRGLPEFQSISVAIKRANNLLKQARDKGWKADADGSIDEISAADPSEAALKLALINVKPRLSVALEHNQFRDAFMELSPLRKPVDDFFTNVMVMVDDEKVRSERLRLLSQLKRMFDLVADFSKLQPLTSK